MEFFLLVLLTEIEQRFFHLCLPLLLVSEKYKNKVRGQSQYGKESSGSKMRAETVKCVTKLFCLTQRVRSFWVGGTGSALTQLKKYKHICTVNITFPRLLYNKQPPIELFLPSPHFSCRAGILGKSSMTSLRQPADFHPGEEEWEECIDVWKQTTALCVLERPDRRKEWNLRLSSRVQRAKLHCTFALCNIVTSASFIDADTHACH